MRAFGRAAAAVVVLAVALPAAAHEIPIRKPPRHGRPDRGQPEKPGKPVVVVFDFHSEYDGGKMGRTVAANVWAKLDRSGECVLLERGQLLDVVKDAGYVPAFDAKPAEVARFLADKFGASHGIWGQVEQVDRGGPAAERRLRISARSVSAEDGKSLGVDMSQTVRNQRTIQFATKEIVRRFLGFARPKPDVGEAEEERWRTGPNLVKNPGFEAGDDHPQFWEPFNKSYHHESVSWVAAPGGKGKCIKFTMNRGVASSYGVGYYSDPISIQDGEIYRFSVRVRSDSPTVKIFLKHYRLYPPGPNEKKGQWRETRRAPMNCYFDEKGAWQTFTRDFRPHRDDEHDPTVTRVELYAYFPPGVVYFDDVVMKKIKDRAPQDE